MIHLAEVDRDIIARLCIYVNLLARWRKITNLVSETTFAQIWSRHVVDSAQLLKLAPTASRWVDLGSGAGFPGIVIALQLSKSSTACVHLVECDRRKCAFLHEVVRATSAPAQIHPVRIETLHPETFDSIDAVTARGFTSFARAIKLANFWLSRGATGLFPQGRSAARQIEGFVDTSVFDIETFSSSLDCQAKIVRVRSKTEAIQ
jgi:16S rRNA (guanine527-N7)-methyltransferase